jgi:ABC-type multidrug transport system fused ATPase/permease subunit
MATACLMLLLSTGLFLAVPRLLGHAIDAALASASAQQLVLLGISVIAVIGLRGLSSYANLYLGESVSHLVAYRIRNRLYDKLQHLSFSFHDHEHTGNLMSKATVDVEMIRMFVNAGLVRAGQMLTLIVGATAMMLIIDWQMGLVGMLMVPLIAVRAVTASRELRAMWRQTQVATGRMTTTLQENLAGQKVVKAFGAEEYEADKYAADNQLVHDWTLSTRRRQAENSATMQAIFWSTTVLVLWIGGHRVMAGRITVGELGALIIYMSLLVQPVRMIGQLVNAFARAISAGERIFDVLDAVSPVQNRPDARPLGEVHGRVQFDHVSFSYGEQRILHDVSLDVKPGEVVALLGAPGSGKSTLVHLLARFYDVTGGRLLVDGTDVRDLDLASLRRAVGIVQQDVFLFSATVHENIAYGREQATREDVVAAAETAQLHDEILALPDGYDTLVGERGMTLSGGQRQRLAIARTLLLDPPILVLDDSTSSVDAGTEAKIQRALADVVRGRTTFIIAHRLSSIQNASHVVVFDRGRIAESGAPQQLMAAGGLLTRVAELQYAANHNGHPPAQVQSRGASAS